MRLSLLPLSHRDPRTEEPEALLGHEHPLVGAEERMRRLRRQVVAVTALLAGAVVVLLVELADTRGLLLAAGLALGWLTISLVMASTTRRDRALDLIAEGRDALPLEAVRQARRRLMDPRRAGDLARSLDHIRSEARAGALRRGIGPPLFCPPVIRRLDPEIARIVDLLSSPTPNIVVVARAARLLGGEQSPLYGEDPRRLREELRRIELAS